jgi:uncharacterized RDD family membrane protein YckC
MTQDLVILSPEKTILSYRLASLGSRTWALFIDLLIIGCIIFGATILLGVVSALGIEGLAEMVYVIIIAALPFLYPLLLEAMFNGVTPGKKAMGIRVRMADGTPITAQAAIIRNLLRPADMLPGTYLLGIIAVFLNPKSQRIGDLAAGTVVVQERLVPPRFQPTPYALGVHRYEGLIGELRGMTREDYDALRRLCDRFPEFGPSVQNKMIREVWKPVATRLAIPDYPEIHAIYLAEATVMNYGRTHGLL